MNYNIKNNKAGTFVVSLDFELIWGVFDKVNPDEKYEYFKNTRLVIPEILKLFREYDIHCTWAVVGMLFNNDFEEWNNNIPGETPNYIKEELSAYKFGNMRAAIDAGDIYFARDIINIIKQTPHQEIGTHTYSHYYCLEQGQTLSAFKADLKKAVIVASDLGVDVKSLVFPRNQFNEEYLEACYKLGIVTVRSNPSSWYWKDTSNNSLLRRIFRTGDAYIGLNNKSYISGLLEQGKPYEQKASRLLRPYSSSAILNKLKIRRIRSEMITAAIKGETYHLWWHPHNFGTNKKQNLQDLAHILEIFVHCRNKYGFTSKTMYEQYLTAKK